MKAVILAGGLGSRLSEETVSRPKPMIEIGGRPILWHIMKIYGFYGINDFIICLGYKGYLIKEYFANYHIHNADISVDLAKNTVEYHSSKAEPWRVTLVDTGDATQTGGRIARVREHLESEQQFCLTYGDGVGDVNIADSIDFHKKSGRAATMTVVSPPGRFGAALIENDCVTAFVEKPRGDGAQINAGFFVCNRDVLEYIDSDASVWEEEPLRALAQANELSAYVHNGFWKPMDTLREKNELEEMWRSDTAQWKLWTDA